MLSTKGLLDWVDPTAGSPGSEAPPSPVPIVIPTDAPDPCDGRDRKPPGRALGSAVDSGTDPGTVPGTVSGTGTVPPATAAGVCPGTVVGAPVCPGTVIGVPGTVGTRTAAPGTAVLVAVGVRSWVVVVVVVVVPGPAGLIVVDNADPWPSRSAARIA